MESHSTFISDHIHIISIAFVPFHNTLRYDETTFSFYMFVQYEFKYFEIMLLCFNENKQLFEKK